MSARKVETKDLFQSLTVQARSTHLHLPASRVQVHRSGNEVRGLKFLSNTSIPSLTEITIDMQIPGDTRPVGFAGVVVACVGNRHSGFTVTVLFTSLTPKAQARLTALAVSA